MNKHPWPTSLVATLILCAAVNGLCAQENANAPRYAPGLLQCFSAYQESILNLWPLQIILVVTGTLNSPDGAKLMRIMNERLCAAMDDWQCDAWLEMRLATAAGAAPPG